MAALRVATRPPTQLAEMMAPVVVETGLELTDDIGGADALIWCSPWPTGLADLLDDAPQIRWVQLPYAGVEAFLQMIDDRRTWTCAKDIYGPTVAEFALGMLLAGVRRIDRFVRATSWQPLEESTLRDANVLIYGAGGIGRCLTEMLVPLGSNVTVVSRSGRPVRGARAVRNDEAEPLLPTADAVVLAVPLTDATTGMVDSAFLGSMKSSAWLVNVARGKVVVTDDLVKALESGAIGGAAIDVTDPEPLPPEHRLWQLDNVIITPHAANTAALGAQSLLNVVRENAERFARGETLKGIVDPAAGY